MNLTKMLKDAKNKEFLDVIYFGLAELSKRQGKIKEAIPLYAKSLPKALKTTLKNLCQAYILADIYYTNKTIVFLKRTTIQR